MDHKHGLLKKLRALAPQSSGLREMLSKSFVHAIIIIALGFVLYISTFDSPFAFDDDLNIQNNTALYDMRYFTDSALQDKALLNMEIDEHFRSRIVGYLTFALNYKVHGLQVQGYHIFNLLIHLASSILAYFLVLLTTRTPWFRKMAGDTEDPYSYRMAALFAGLLFVSHPVQTQAVTYITQRFASLATMFCLLSLVLYIKARLLAKSREQRAEGNEQRAKRYAPGAMLYAGCLLSAVLAMKTKEMSFILPVVIALYEIMFFEGKAKKRLLYLLPLLLTMLIIPLTVLGEKTVITEIKIIGESVQGGQSENTALSYLLTQFRVIVTYLRLMVLPVNQNVDYGYPVYHSFFNPNVFLSFIFLAGIFAAGVYLYCRSGREKARNRQWLRLMSFGIFWFFITLSVESSIIPLLDIISEHRLYLPSAGFFMVVVSVAAIGKSRLEKTGTKAITLFMAFAILALSVATFQRNQLWGDEVKLWEDVVKKSPDKAGVHNNLGNAYLAMGRIDEAFNEFMTALKINPNYAEVHINLGVIYAGQGQMDKAINEYLAALKIKPDIAGAHYNLGLVYAGQGQTDKAINEYLAALKVNSNIAEIHNNLGVAYANIGSINEAVNEFKEALRLDSKYIAARKNLELVVRKMGRDNLMLNKGNPE